ncbi:hypothetical protein CBR_g22293 [Chara braunii]|uniref:Ubiquitin-like protease family profile domain-containing protein n=1 Tax=Chara braunii TaxID=69332 RepID=A0A388L2K9_CHABU|nr:hypothetical protein CBR_g22293 [Chara braunii]|eukprot:GBG76545.1 hypothetical protein CBR_g22293 [Chara braunii]
MRTTEEKKNVGDDSVAEVTIDSNQEKTISTKQENPERSKVETQKVDKGASHTEKRPQATTREDGGEVHMMTMKAISERWEHLSQKDPWYNRMYLAATRGTIRSADLGQGESCGKMTQANKDNNASSSSDEFEVVDETNIYSLMWKGKREKIRLAEADVMCLAVGKWLNDNVMDMYLISIYEEQLQGKDTAAVNVCTTFWHPEVLANQKVDTVKRGWELRVKSWTTKIHRLCKDLEVAPVVLIPINHKHHWILLIMLNVREFWTDCTCPDAIIVDSCDGYATPDWRALRTLMWHEYLNDKRRGPDVARQLVDKSWNTCRDVFGRGLIHARFSQRSNREDCGVYVCCMAEELITKLAHPPTENGVSKDDILEIVTKMHIDGRIVEHFRRRAVDRIVEYEDIASSLKQVQETHPPARLREKTAVRKEKGKFQRGQHEKSKTSPLLKSHADRAAVTTSWKANRSDFNKRQRESVPASPASTKNRMRQDRSPPQAPKKRSCAEGVEVQPRHNITNAKRRRIIEGEEEGQETIDLRGSEGVEVVNTEKRHESRDTAGQTQRSDAKVSKLDTAGQTQNSDPYDETNDGEGRNKGTCDEGQSYGEDASKEEEDSEKGYNNTEDSDGEVKEEEDISRSSIREERCSEDNTQNTSRKTQGGRSHGRRHDSNANKQLVLKEKAIEGRKYAMYEKNKNI